MYLDEVFIDLTCKHVGITYDSNAELDIWISACSATHIRTTSHQHMQYLIWLPKPNKTSPYDVDVV